MDTRFLQLLMLKNLHLKRGLGFLYDELHAPLLAEGAIDVRHLPNALNSLKQTVDSCLLCELSKGEGKPSFGACLPESRVIFISEIPLVDPDNPVRILGRSGALLQGLLREFIGIGEREVSFLSLLKCQPKPTLKLEPAMFSACKPYMLKQLELLNERAIIVPLGEVVYENLLGDVGDFIRHRGQKISWLNRVIIPTYSPSHILRNPSVKSEVERDFCLIRSLI